MRHAITLFTMTGLLVQCLLVGAVSGEEKIYAQGLGGRSSSNSFIGEVSRGEEKTLQVGDLAPEFQCLDDQGQIWNSSEHVGKKVVVLYFYPSDFAFCCTRQAVRYRDCQKELTERGVEVIGVSGDAVPAHRLFKDTHQLKQTLLADVDGELARQFGVPLRDGGKAMPKDASDKELLDRNGHVLSFPRTVTAARWTFIIDQDGRVIYREVDVSPVKDSQEVVEFLRTR